MPPTSGGGVRLAGVPSSLPPAPDLAAALRTSAGQLGHRPAVTVVRPDRRDEQGFASLLKWAAKGAHLLELEAGLGPGDRLALASPPGWPAAAVCLAAWWVGVAVVLDGDADVAVVHEERPAPAAAESYAIGDAADGSPSGPGEGPAAEPWSEAVQAFPDQPPTPQADGAAPAIVVGGRILTHAEVLDAAGRWGGRGPLGIDASAPPGDWVPALVRPLRTGLPTVVLAGVGRGAAAREGVAVWV